MELLELLSFILHSILLCILYCTFNSSISITVTCLSKISKTELVPCICYFLINSTLFKNHRIIQIGEAQAVTLCNLLLKTKSTLHSDQLAQGFVQLDLENF